MGKGEVRELGEASFNSSCHLKRGVPFKLFYARSLLATLREAHQGPESAFLRAGSHSYSLQIAHYCGERRIKD